MRRTCRLQASRSTKPANTTDSRCACSRSISTEHPSVGRSQSFTRGARTSTTMRTCRYSVRRTTAIPPVDRPASNEWATRRTASKGKCGAKNGSSRPTGASGFAAIDRPKTSSTRSTLGASDFPRRRSMTGMSGGTCGFARPSSRHFSSIEARASGGTHGKRAR